MCSSGVYSLRLSGEQKGFLHIPPPSLHMLGLGDPEKKERMENVKKKEKNTQTLESRIASAIV